MLEKGKFATIQVIEPFELSSLNLSCEVLSIIENKILFVRLSKPIQHTNFTSTLISLQPRYKNESFDLLGSLDSIMVNGMLLKENSEFAKFIFTGKMSIH